MNTDEQMQKLQYEYTVYAEYKAYYKKQTKKCDTEMDKIKKQIGELSKIKE